jgi:signal transduction histidine kinase
MIDSLRARLLIWFTAVLMLAIAGFGALVLYVVWRGRLAEIDAALAARADALVLALQPAPDGTFDLALPAARVGQVDDARFYHAIWTHDGAPIDRSDTERASRRPAGPGLETRDGRRELTREAVSGALVQVGRDLADVRANLWNLAASVAVVGALAAVLAAAGGWFLAAGVLRPIRRISDTARAMVDGDFAARIPVDRVETELGQLGGALNEAFDRLHAALERQQRFTADASHELRTPLTTLTTELQWTTSRPRTPEEYQRSLAAMRRAADRMQGIVERLLALARAGAADEGSQPIALDTLTRGVIDVIATLALRKDVTIDAALEPVSVYGPPAGLREAVTNVLANAVQYNVSGGRIDVELAPAGRDARLVVRDTGIGIAPDQVPRIFEPFFRTDPARSRDAGGAGLGLALAHAVVTRIDGTIACSSEPGRGTTIEITLPRMADQ